MTLPASLPISLAQIQTEFGAPAGTALGQFLRGGIYVPNTAQNLGVPTALPISISQFVGAGANPIVFPNTDVLGFTISPADATAGFILANTGQRQQNVNGSVTDLGAWLTAGSAADYACFATVNSGTLTSGTTGVWENLGTSRSWTRVNTNNAPSAPSVNLIIQIRRVSDSVVMATATVNLTAQVDT